MTHDGPPDLSGLLGASSLGDSLAEIVRLAAPIEVVPGWATVELARAAGPAAIAAASAADHLLGAVAAIVRIDPGQAVVLLEPSTEGALAAALARHGEGWIAAYLRGVPPTAADQLRAAGYKLSPIGRGPFGPERRVLAGRPDGPFLLLVAEP